MASNIDEPQQKVYFHLVQAHENWVVENATTCLGF